MFYKKLITTLMLFSTLSLSVTPLTVLATDSQTESSAETVLDPSFLEETSEDKLLSTEPSLTEDSANQTIPSTEIVDNSGTEENDSPLLIEDTETEEDDYTSPIIDESNQSALGDTLKATTRSFSGEDRRLAWNQGKLPRTDFIDVSSHQGNISVAEYNNLKKYGVSGVVVKLTESTSYRNPFAKNQIDNAKAAGLKVSVYHYSWFKNKNSAIAEADYFAKFAKELNLGSDTLMVNDIEEPKIKSQRATADSLDFENRLKTTHKFKQVIHYSSLSWFTDGTLNLPKLGGGNAAWIAQYPYAPSKNNLLNQNASAWQWASTMLFPGENRMLDVSIDYNGRFSNRVNLAPQGPYISFNQFVNINNANDVVYSDFNFKVRYNTSEIYQKTLLAKGKYDHVNGITYYSLYDSNNVWKGYIDSKSTTLTKAHGSYIPFNKYVTINSPAYSLWANFNWQRLASSSTVHQKTLLAKGMYRHANGSIYYSLYDSANNWKGYINSSGTSLTAASGPYIGFNQYVKITSPNYSTHSNFSWQQKSTSKNYLNQILLAKGKYNHYNGATYYSLYDTNGAWHGYLNSAATTLAGPQGPYIPFNKSITITNKKYYLWANFNWVAQPNSKGMYNKKLLAKGVYKHINGSIYYSLYDTNNVWKGYINSSSTKLN